MSLTSTTTAVELLCCGNFAAQLLCQHAFDTAKIHQSVDVASVERGGLSGVCQLFEWLVRQLPEETTLICILDNLGQYERDPIVQGASTVMHFVTSLMHNSAIKAIVKILATSTIAVRGMRQFFSKGSTINLSVVPASDRSNRQRMQRQLNTSIEGRQRLVP